MFVPSPRTKTVMEPRISTFEEGRVLLLMMLTDCNRLYSSCFIPTMGKRQHHGGDATFAEKNCHQFYSSDSKMIPTAPVSLRSALSGVQRIFYQFSRAFWSLTFSFILCWSHHYIIIYGQSMIDTVLLGPKANFLPKANHRTE